METRVYVVPKDLASKIVDSPDVKRYGEAKNFDSAVLGLNEKGSVVVIRGDSKIFDLELFEGLEESKDKEEIIKKVEELDDAAASGVGMLFG